jgi:hypothetical protein
MHCIFGCSEQGATNLAPQIERRRRTGFGSAFCLLLGLDGQTSTLVAALQIHFSFLLD